MKPGQCRAWPCDGAGGRGARGRRGCAAIVVVAAQSTPPDGQSIFRHDTFGDEQLWTDVLRMHEVVAKLTPATALKVGLKVDVEALPQNVINDLRAGRVNLDDPAVTLLLLPSERRSRRARRLQPLRPAREHRRDLRAVPFHS